jgi:hypothetical protein
MRYNKLSLSLLVTFFLCTITVRAQTSFGIQAGVSFSNVTMKGEHGEKRYTQAVSGLRLGLNAEIPLSHVFFVQPAFFYIRKGYKQEDGLYRSGGDVKIKANYIELPINLVFKPNFLSRHLYIGAGPYLGYGLGGSWRSKTGAVIGDIQIGNKGDIIFRNDAAEGGSIESFVYGKPFDYGANFLAGYVLPGGLSVQVNGQLGLANLNPKFSGTKLGGTLKNTSWGVSLGYKF